MNEEAEVKDATYRVAEADENGNLPAPLEMFRHPLMEGKMTEYVEDIAEELELDKKLDLPNQEVISGARLIREDIDELTKSNEYFQITEAGLTKMFKIRPLNLKCSVHNNIQFMKALSTVFGPCMAFIGLAIPAWMIAINTPGFVNNIPAIAFSALGIGLFIRTMVKGWTFSWNKIIVRLKQEPVEQTKVRIPKGAKCKLLEAKETGIFKDFFIAYPNVDIENKTVTSPEIKINLELDPAIMGRTDDGRAYMVCWWDIKKDIDRAINQIDKIKNLKIEY